MKLILFSLAAALLMTVAAPTHSRDSIAPPVGAVRAVSVDGHKFCSAVVIAPNVAVTAGHCLKRQLAVDGIKATKVTTSPQGKDIAVLRVPGLKCPCATIGVRPAKGDQVLAVGYPVDREGERVVSPVARVSQVAPMNVLMPEFPDASEEIYIATDAPIITHGDSGGALFSMQNGKWRVVGINAIGIPDIASCRPWVGCEKDLGSGFVPADLAKEFL